MGALLLALVAGAIIGLSLGALGGGGSILAVPVLVYLLDQSPAQATTGSLVVVAVTSLLAAVTAHREGNVLLGRGVTFGLVAIGGAAAGSLAAARVPEAVLMAASLHCCSSSAASWSSASTATTPTPAPP